MVDVVFHDFTGGLISGKFDIIYIITHLEDITYA